MTAPDCGPSPFSGTFTYEELLERDGLLITTNVGTSMMPLLRQGRDLMVIESLPKAQAEAVREAAEKPASEGKPEGKRRFGPRRAKRPDGRRQAAACPAPRAKRYDAVLYKRGGKYILHRVLGVGEQGYTICGDHCVRLEKNVPESALLGVLVQVDRDGRALPVDMRWRERGNEKPPLIYRAYVHAWCDLYPVRATLLTAKRLGFGAARRMKRLAGRR